MTVPPAGPSPGGVPGGQSPYPPPEPGRVRAPLLLAGFFAVAIGAALIVALTTSGGAERPGRDTSAPAGAVRDLLDAEISGDDAMIRAVSCRADVEGDFLGTGTGEPIDRYTVGDITAGNGDATLVSVTITTVSGDSFSMRLPVIPEDGGYKVCNSVASEAIG